MACHAPLLNPCKHARNRVLHTLLVIGAHLSMFGEWQLKGRDPDGVMIVNHSLPVPHTRVKAYMVKVMGDNCNSCRHVFHAPCYGVDIRLVANKSYDVMGPRHLGLRCFMSLLYKWPQATSGPLRKIFTRCKVIFLKAWAIPWGPPFSTLRWIHVSSLIGYMFK